MGCLLRLITVMLLTVGVFLWFFFLTQLYEKVAHPQQRNLSSGEFFLTGLVLTFFTIVTYLGFRSRSKSGAA